MRFSRPFLFALLLSLCVHLITLVDGDWLPGWNSAPQAPAKLRPLTARLLAQHIAEPAQVSAPPQPEPTLAPITPKPRPHKRRHAKPAPNASAPLAQQEASAAASTAKAEASAPAVASAPAAATTTPASTPSSASTADGGGFPPRGKIRYQLSWNGLPANGEMRLENKNGHYHLELQGSAFGFTQRFISDGLITKQGLKPEKYQVLRGGEVRDSASFDWGSNTLHYGDGEQKQAPLEPGAQDFVSLAWHLAITGGGNGHPNLLVTNGKKVYHYPLTAAGEATYPGDSGLAAVVFRAQNADNATEFWLARKQFNLPVKVVFKDDQKTIRLDMVHIDIDGHPAQPVE